MPMALGGCRVQNDPFFVFQQKDRCAAARLPSQDHQRFGGGIVEAQANPLAQLTCLVAFGGEQGDRKALLPLFPCLAHDVGRRLPQPKGRAFAPVGLVAIWDTLGVERPRHTLAADSQGFLQELGKVLSNVGKSTMRSGRTAR